MKKAIQLVCVATIVAGLGSAAMAALPFSDDFDRPDGIWIGNGWGMWGGSVSLRSGRLYAGGSGIMRDDLPFPFNGSMSFDFDFTVTDNPGAWTVQINTTDPTGGWDTTPTLLALLQHEGESGIRRRVQNVSDGWWHSSNARPWYEGDTVHVSGTVSPDLSVEVSVEYFDGGPAAVYTIPGPGVDPTTVDQGMLFSIGSPGGSLFFDNLVVVSEVPGSTTFKLNGIPISNTELRAAITPLLAPGDTLSGQGTLDGVLTGAAASSVVADDGDMTLGDPASFTGFSTEGTIDTQANTVTLRSAGFAALGIETALGGGTLAAPNGVGLGVGDNLAGSGTVNAKVSAAFASTIEATGDLVLGAADAYDGFFSDGSLITGAHTVTINDRNEAVLGSLTQLGDGVTGGTLTAGNAIPADTHAHFLLEQGKNMVGRGSVNGNYKNHGHVIGDGIAPPQRIVFESGWTVTGKGTFEYVGFKGTFAPGDSPTIASTTHAWYADATVQVELGGTTPGSGNDNHDQINDTATVWLDHDEPPTLEILPWSNFVPEIGDEFVILTWQTSLDGSFDDVIVDPWFTDRGLGFDLHYNNVDGAGNLTIEATPEPATLSLLALGGLAMLRRRKRGMCK